MQETHWILLPVVLPLSILRLAISRAAAVLLSIRHFGDLGLGAAALYQAITLKQCRHVRQGRLAAHPKLSRCTGEYASTQSFPAYPTGKRYSDSLSVGDRERLRIACTIQHPCLARKICGSS